MLIMDGIAWTVPCDIQRTSEIRESDISGWMMDGTYLSDVLGTYVNYSVTLLPNPRAMGDYYALYEAINAPVGSHEFVLPYNAGTLTMSGKVGNIRDVYTEIGGNPYWRGVRFDITGTSPIKQPTLSWTIARGVPALPDVASPAIGDTYTYTANGWVAVSD